MKYDVLSLTGLNVYVPQLTEFQRVRKAFTKCIDLCLLLLMFIEVLVMDEQMNV